jgi:AcrR family transcriptional regulator
MQSMADSDKSRDLVARRKAEIAAGALPLFLEKGFHGTSIREIAAASGLSMGGLYEYITSKDDVLSLVYREMTSPLGEALDRPVDSDLRELVADALEASWQRAKDVQILYRETVSLDADHREEVAQSERVHAHRIADSIEAAVERGELVCDDPLLVGHLVIFLAAFAPLRSWIMRKDGIDCGRAAAETLAGLIVAGLRPGSTP